MQRSWKTFLVPALLGTTVLVGVACHGPRGGFGNMTEAEVAERMTDVAEFGLDTVDADDQQVERVNGLLTGAAPDVVRFRAEHKALAAELRAELAKDTIDRDRIEALRKRALDLFDRASQKGSDTLVSVAEVLTPAQRKELTYKWEKHQH
jgi:Spy/CpxP family protein refolding chaperone